MVTGGAADDDGDGDGRGSGRGGGAGHGCLASSSEASASRALAKFTMSLSEPSGSRNRYMPDQRSSTTIRGFRVTLRRRVATIPGADFIALRAFLRAVAALQAAVADLCAAVRALERRGVKDAPQEAQKLLRSRARLPIVPMQSISPLGHGSRRGPSLFVLRFAVIGRHGHARAAASRSARRRSSRSRGIRQGWVG